MREQLGAARYEYLSPDHATIREVAGAVEQPIHRCEGESLPGGPP